MWLYRGQLDSHICFYWQYVVLVKIYEENLAWPRYVVRKERSILIAFSHNLRLHQNSTSSIFLNGSCNLEYETISMNFLYSIILKSINLPCSMNGSVSHAWFYNIPLQSFGKYCFIGLYRPFKHWYNSLYNSKNYIC